MKELLDIIENAIPCSLYANRTRSMGECVVYDWYSTGYNGSKREIMLKTYTYAETMERALAIQGCIDHALVTQGDSALTGRALSCRQNGGGWLTEGTMHCRISYYEIILREGK